MINFKSKIEQVVLGYLLLNPEEELYVNEMSNRFNVNRGNLTKKLSEWEKEGIVIKTNRGNLSLYRINSNYYLLPELKKIAQKSFGIEKKLKNALSETKGLKSAFIFGSYAKDAMEAESDIDLFLVGSHKAIEVEEKIIDIEKEAGREINIVDMTEKEFNEKKKTNDFLKNVLSNKIIQII